MLDVFGGLADQDFLGAVLIDIAHLDAQLRADEVLVEFEGFLSAAIDIHPLLGSVFFALPLVVEVAEAIDICDGVSVGDQRLPDLGSVGKGEGTCPVGLSPEAQPVNGPKRHTSVSDQLEQSSTIDAGKHQGVTLVAANRGAIKAGDLFPGPFDAELGTLGKGAGELHAQGIGLIGLATHLALNRDHFAGSSTGGTGITGDIGVDCLPATWDGSAAPFGAADDPVDFETTARQQVEPSSGDRSRSHLGKLALERPWSGSEELGYRHRPRTRTEKWRCRHWVQ